MPRILIIKLGYSETLDKRSSLSTSLGDVLRTTVILNFFKEDRVDWLVDKKATPLLKGNDFIDKIWDFNKKNLKVLASRSYDTVVNLEKIPWVCSFADSLLANKHLGFSRKYKIKNNRMLETLSLSIQKRRKNRKCWQEVLALSLDKKWRQERYILGYKPRSKEVFDVGLNWTTSNKWANKAWPRKNWDELAGLLKKSYSVSWQKGLRSLYEYIDWVNSCRVIVSADTLGLHLALALKKKVVALFGPTSDREIYFYNLGSPVLPDISCSCRPCLKTRCAKKIPCMGHILPKKVAKAVKREIVRG